MWSFAVLCCFHGERVASIVALLSGYAQREHQAYRYPHQRRTAAHRGVIDPHTDTEPLHYSHTAIQNFSYRFLLTHLHYKVSYQLIQGKQQHLRWKQNTEEDKKKNLHRWPDKFVQVVNIIEYACISFANLFNYAWYMKNNRLINIKHTQCVNHKLYVCWPEHCCTKCINIDIQHWNQQNHSLQSRAAWYIETK